MNKKFLFWILIPISLLFSCKRDRSMSWETEILSPIVHTKLNLSNLTNDSLVKTNDDNSLSLVLRNPLYEFIPSNLFIELPDTFTGIITRMDSLDLGHDSVTKEFSLGQLALNMIAQGPPSSLFGSAIIGLNDSVSTIPAIPPQVFPPQSYDNGALFSSATLLRGQFDMFLRNRFPIDITNVKYRVKNHTDGTILVFDSIPIIPAGTEVYKFYTLDGKTIESIVDVEILNVESPGSGATEVLIDTSDYIQFGLYFHGLRASEATAVFPDQEVSKQTGEITLDLDDRKFMYIAVTSGSLDVTLRSSVQEDLDLTYVMEGAYDGAGRPLTITTTVPASDGISLGEHVEHIDLSGFNISLTGLHGDKFNTYTQSLSARIHGSGEMRTIHGYDSLRISFELNDIKPNYIKGYAGQESVDVGPEVSPTDVFDMIKSGTIDVDDVKMNIDLENWLGIDGRVNIANMQARKGATTVDFIAPDLIATDVDIPRATNFPLTPSHTVIELNKTNSNSPAIFNLLPDAFGYEMNVQLNPFGNISSYQDFAYFDRGVRINMDMELPLSFTSNKLLLMDTINFSLGEGDDEASSIKSGTFYLIANNSYPLSADISMILYDEYWSAVDTIIQNFNAEAGELNSICRVDLPQKSIYEIKIDENRMQLIKQARHAVLMSSLTTNTNVSCSSGRVKIYSDYELDIRLSARFSYIANED